MMIACAILYAILHLTVGFFIAKRSVKKMWTREVRTHYTCYDCGSMEDHVRHKARSLIITWPIAIPMTILDDEIETTDPERINKLERELGITTNAERPIGLGKAIWIESEQRYAGTKIVRKDDPFSEGRMDH